MRAGWLVCMAGIAALASCGGDDVGDLPPGDGTTSDGPSSDGPDVDGPVIDASEVDAPTIDAAVIDAAVIDATVIDTAVIDAAVIDAAVIDAAVIDATAIDAPMIDAPTGPITGGPCISGAPGATAYRIRWAGSINGPAYVVYEVNGLPDHSRDHAGAYGYQIGFTPSFVDPFLGEGGLQLNSSSFVDLELTTAGISNIASIHLSIYGRSYSTGSSGSFNWMSFEGSGATVSNFVSNVAPYRWYSADMTGDITAGNPGVLLRIKAGPSSGSLVVNRIELCVVAT